MDSRRVNLMCRRCVNVKDVKDPGLKSWPAFYANVYTGLNRDETHGPKSISIINRQTDRPAHTTLTLLPTRALISLVTLCRSAFKCLGVGGGEGDGGKRKMERMDRERRGETDKEIERVT